MVLKLQTRVGLVFAAALATLILVLLVTAVAYQTARHENATLTATQFPSLEASRRMLEISQDLFFTQVIYIDDAAARVPSRMRDAQLAAEWRSRYQEALRHADTPQERALMASIGPRFEAFMAVGDRIRAATDAGRLTEARRLHKDESRLTFLPLRTDLGTFRDLNARQVAALSASAVARFDWVEAIAIGIAALGTLLAGYLWWRASQDIVRPLRSLTEATRAMEEGRFVVSRDPHATTTIELAALQHGFNRMSQQLAEAGMKLLDANANLEAQVAERTRELSEANMRLEHLVTELKTLDQLKSNFMAVMIHELLTPINFITGFGSALEDEILGPLNEKQLETVQKMMAGADRLTRMVRNTLEYTQLEAGTLEIRPEAVDYAEVLQDAADAAEATLGPRRQTLTLTLPPEVPAVTVDPDRARQVLAELLDNASKFSPEGSRLHLRVTVGPDVVETELADPGMGIPEDALPQLFMPFYQVDSSRTRAHTGMGLGLPIAYHLVARMGGSMLIASTEGQGTTIRFTLPRAVPAPADDARTGGPATESA